MGAGSVRGSIFSLCTSAIGAGVLSLPYVLALNGYVIGIIFIIIGAIGANWSNIMLADMACKYKILNYHGLCIKAGGPNLAKLLSWCVIVYMFGVLISYQIIMTQLFKYAIVHFGVNKDFGNSSKMSIYQSVPTVVLFLYPLCIKRDMSAYRYVSMFSIGALVYTAIVLIIELPSYYKYFHDPKVGGGMPAYYIDFNLFTGCAMTFYSYTCQIQMLPIYSELVQPSYRRMSKVIHRAITVDLSFYLLIACVGYFSQFEKTDPIVLKRIVLPGHGKDIPILIAVIANVFCVVVAFPTNYNPFR